MHLDVLTVQHGTLSAISVVTLGIGSQSAEEVPLPTNRMGNTTPHKGKKHHGKKGHTDIIKMKEFDGQYVEMDIHFVGPYPAIAADPDEIKIDDIKRPRKTEAYTTVHLPADCDGKTNASV